MPPRRRIPQMMAVLSRLVGADTSDSPLGKGMAWALENCFSDGSNPNGTITRQQLATILYRNAGSPAVDGALHFPDADSVANHAKAAILWAAQTDIIGGYPSDTLEPTSLATHAQVVTMMACYYAQLA